MQWKRKPWEVEEWRETLATPGTEPDGMSGSVSGGPATHGTTPESMSGGVSGGPATQCTEPEIMSTSVSGGPATQGTKPDGMSSGVSGGPATQCTEPERMSGSVSGGRQRNSRTPDEITVSILGLKDFRADNKRRIGDELIALYEALGDAEFRKQIYGRVGFLWMTARTFMLAAGWVSPPRVASLRAPKHYGHEVVVKEWATWPPKLKAEHTRWLQERINEERSNVLG